MGVVRPISDTGGLGQAGQVAKGKKVGLTQNPLASPKKLIHKLASEIQDWIYYPDPGPLYLVLGTLVANMMTGSPVWIMLIGPPSSGRTLILDALFEGDRPVVEKLHRSSAIKGPSALLSGTSRKEVVKGATGGLMRKIGRRGALVMKDFTSMLAMNRDALNETISAFRDIYDGHWSRDIGSDGGRSLIWDGHVGFLGACTPALDRHHGVIHELGQRWMYYRYPYSDGFGESLMVLKHLDFQDIRCELASRVRAFIEVMGFEWDMERRPLNKGEENRIVSMAQLMVKTRSAPSRDPRTHEINDIPQSESPQRMASALGQLYIGLEAIGLDEAERWRLVGKVALDSAPQLKCVTVAILRSAGGPILMRDMAAKMQCSTETVKRVCQDLEIFGVAERHEANACLSPWAERLFAVGWAGVPVVEPVQASGVKGVVREGGQ